MVSTTPTLADLQAVPLAAWRGAILLADASLDDWRAAVAAQLSTSKFPGGLARLGVRVVSPTGTRYLAALRALVDGLRSIEVECLAGHTNAAATDGMRFDMFTASMLKSGVVQRAAETRDVHLNNDCWTIITDLGRAALLLMEVDRG